MRINQRAKRRYSHASSSTALCFMPAKPKNDNAWWFQPGRWEFPSRQLEPDRPPEVSDPNIKIQDGCCASTAVDYTCLLTLSNLQTRLRRILRWSKLKNKAHSHPGGPSYKVTALKRWRHFWGIFSETLQATEGFICYVAMLLSCYVATVTSWCLS